MKILKIWVLAFVLTQWACANLPKIETRIQPVPTTFDVKVATKAKTDGTLKESIISRVRRDLLKYKMGVPVVSNTKGQLGVVVEIKTTNLDLNTATNYNWRLVDNNTGSILVSKSESSITGHSPQMLSATILTGISHIDLSAYASDQNIKDQPKLVKEKVRSFPASSTKGKNNFAIIIGVEKYRGEITPALYAENDARSFEGLLKGTLNIPEENIKVLINERAAKTDIMGAIFEWLPKNVQSSNAKVFVFFSGHGAPKLDSGDAYLLPYDADPAYLKTGGISVHDVQEELSKLKSNNVYLFLDSCFSGSGPRSVIAKGTRPLVPVQEVKSGGVIVLTASAASETTGVHESAKNGLFTHYLILSMVGKADKNADHIITFKEVEEYVSWNVNHDARKQNREQSPTAKIPQKTEEEKLLLVDGLSE